MGSETLSLITIPLFSGAIGYVTNWSGVIMLFYPVRLRGLRVPGLAAARSTCCRARSSRSRADARRPRLAGDHPLARGEDGQPRGRQGDREARQRRRLLPSSSSRTRSPSTSSTSARGDMRELVERIAGARAPAAVARPAAAGHARRRTRASSSSCRTSSARSPTRSATNIDQLLDVKLMVIRRMEANPALANRIFLEVGRKELRFIINFGFFFGFLLGIPTAIAHRARAHPVVGAADLRRADRLHDEPARRS